MKKQTADAVLPKTAPHIDGLLLPAHLFKSRRLSEKAKDDPLDVLSEVFGDASLSCLKEYLSQMLRFALVSEKTVYEEGWERARLITFYDRLLPLIEALYLVEGHNWFEELDTIEYLDESEVAQPNKVVRNFCRIYPIDHSRTELWDFLHAVICYEEEEPKPPNQMNMLDNYEFILSLVEAAYALL